MKWTSNGRYMTHANKNEPFVTFINTINSHVVSVIIILNMTTKKTSCNTKFMLNNFQYVLRTPSRTWSYNKLSSPIVLDDTYLSVQSALGFKIWTDHVPRAFKYTAQIPNVNANLRSSTHGSWTLVQLLWYSWARIRTTASDPLN